MRQWAIDELARHGIDSPARTADEIFSFCAGAPPHILQGGDGTLRADAIREIQRCVTRRIDGEPLQHIIGRWGFWSLDLRVSPDVLIPRPETEHLVEEAVAAARQAPAGDLSIADIGTGSGNIAIALAVELPRARITAVDISARALAVARENISTAGVTHRVACVLGDGLSPLRGAWDMIVSNPPYIPSGDIDTLEKEVREHEPRLALDGGPDGLRAYREIIPGALPLLRPGGSLLLEIGDTQAPAVVSMMADAGYRGIASRNDLQGLPRVVTGRRG